MRHKWACHHLAAMCEIVPDQIAIKGVVATAFGGQFFQLITSPFGFIELRLRLYEMANAVVIFSREPETPPPGSIIHAVEDLMVVLDFKDGYVTLEIQESGTTIEVPAPDFVEFVEFLLGVNLDGD